MHAGFPVIACLCALATSPAAAITGNAPAAPMQGRNAVMITGSGGTFCTGTAIARDLVLTAAHCVLPGASYKLIEFDAGRAPQFLDVREIARHPNFDLQTLLGHRATADVALIKLARPLPAEIAPAARRSRSRATATASPATASRYAATARPAAPCASPHWLQPADRAISRSAWSILPPMVTAPASAPAPAIQGRRSMRAPH
jgi:hypothetical protein